MKKLLISIKPKWVAKILNGEKTLEIRKSCPKCKLPCEVYIYCTKGKPYLTYGGGVYGINDYQWLATTIERRKRKFSNTADFNSKIVAKFDLKKITPIGKDMFGYCPFTKEILDGEWLGKGSCLTQNDLRKYLGDKTGYAWHIDNLKIFDKPRELKDFSVKRSPQSWQFCEVEE